MSVPPGARLGSYEILSAIGAGGMGEVYRARDTKLGREVAIKILPAVFGSDPDRLARFEREARSLAALNHPNIGAIYGVEEAPGIHALVLELVEGETLAERLHQPSRGLPVVEALAIARQIADALEAAHERGIVHRDLKPANVKITPDGVVKVLDFGLAKATAEEGVGSTLSHSPTMAVGATRSGMFLGTASYMSPEQARGLSVDKRADIWAFGCTLYEMLTARAAFPGQTISDIIVRVLERDPDWAALPTATPAAATRLLRRCLEKDPKRRLRDIGDARLEIDESTGGAFWGATPAPVSSAAPRQVLFQRLTDFAGMNESPAISPDSKMVAFVAPVGGRRQIWIRLLAGGAPLQITHDDANHEHPRWTPDSSALIYYTPSDTPGEQGTLWEVSALGGLPRPIVASLGGGDISHDGQRIALFQFRRGRPELVTLARDGSGMERVVDELAGTTCGFPRWSPDDRWLAFQGNIISAFDERLYVVSATGGEPQDIARALSMKGMSWLPDASSLVYSSSAGSTVPYPPTFNLRLVGRDGTRDRQVTFGDLSYSEPDAHHSGKLLACRLRSRSDIWRFPVGGSPAENTREAVRITRQTGQVQTPSVSPDGGEVVYLSDNGGHGNLWVARTDGRSVRQITFESDPAVTVGVPLWSPAGGQIAFIVSRGTSVFSLWSVGPDSRGLRQLIPRGRAACWSPDGQWLYYSAIPDGAEWRMEKIEKVPAGGGMPVLVRNEDNAFAPVVGDSTLYYAVRLRPDLGNWDWEIRRASPEDGPSKVLTHVNGARLPVSSLFVHGNLSRDGRWLALPMADGATSNLWVLPTEGGPMRPLTDFGERPTVIARQVSWSPDGKYLYAAVAETDTDIILLDGLL